jgi:hypothetical protein
MQVMQVMQAFSYQKAPSSLSFSVRPSCPTWTTWFSSGQRGHLSSSRTSWAMYWARASWHHPASFNWFSELDGTFLPNRRQLLPGPGTVSTSINFPCYPHLSTSIHFPSPGRQRRHPRGLKFCNLFIQGIVLQSQRQRLELPIGATMATSSQLFG